MNFLFDEDVVSSLRTLAYEVWAAIECKFACYWHWRRRWQAPPPQLLRCSSQTGCQRGRARRVAQAAPCAVARQFVAAATAAAGAVVVAGDFEVQQRLLAALASVAAAAAAQAAVARRHVVCLRATCAQSYCLVRL